MDKTEQRAAMVSDLMDGHLQGEAFAALLQTAQDDQAWVQTWHVYHVVGDVLRSDDLASAADASFLSRLQGRLAAETQPLAASNVGPQASLGWVQHGSLSANDSWFSWRSTAGALSVALVVAVGWNWVGHSGPSADTPSVATIGGSGKTLAAADMPSSTDSAVMLRDPRLDQLIQAHRQSAGNSALQLPSGFLRNATYDLSQAPGQGR